MAAAVYHCRTCAVVAIALSLLGGIYLYLKDAFLSKEYRILKTAGLLAVVVVLSRADFLFTNYRIVALAIMSAAAYFGVRTYGRLFGLVAHVRFPLVVFFGTRVPLAIVTYLSCHFFGRTPESIWHLAKHWDATYYEGISLWGYWLCPQMSNVAAFCPLMPFLMRSSDFLYEHICFSGAILANLCFLISLMLLYAFVRPRWGEDTAQKTTLLMALGPASFFFSAIYSESLFLMLSLCFFIFLLDKRWAWAGVFGFLAGLARSTGAILAVVWIWEYVRVIRFNPKKIRWDVLWVLLIPVSSAIFAFLLYGSTGEPFANVVVQKAWHREPFQNPITSSLDRLLGLSFEFWRLDPDYAQRQTVEFSWALAYFFAFLCVIPVVRRLGSSLGLFTVLGLLLPLSTGSLEAGVRFAQVLFPITIWLGLKSSRSPTFYAVLLPTFAMLMVFFAIQFVLDMWMV